MKQIKLAVARLWCWWFGCAPYYEAMDHGSEAVPCERCGAWDTTYSDRVGDTRHARFVEAVRLTWWRAVGRWIPSRCPACGERFKCKSDCDGIPF